MYMQMTNNKNDRDKSDLLVRVESSQYGDVVAVESYFDVCSSVIEVCIALDKAVALGVEVISEKEPWLGSENWSEIMKVYLTIHKGFISEQTLVGSVTHISKSSHLEHDKEIHKSTHDKLLIIKNILEINPNARIAEVCKMVDIDIDTFYANVKTMNMKS